MPAPLISSSFLRREFSTLVGTALALRRRGMKVQTSGQVERKDYVGTLKPLIRPDSNLTTSRDSSGSSGVYSWWRHFLLDCGYPPDAALSSPILPGNFNNNLWREWERHIRHSIARVGPVEFISQVESGTRIVELLDKLHPLDGEEKARRLLQPKCRASKEAGPLQPATRGRASRPSPSDGEALRSPRGEDPIGATLHEDVNPLADDDYNPTFDGTPSPDVADLPRASPTEQGYTSANIIADEGMGCPDVTIPIVEGSAVLQAIHDLLTSGPDTGLPDCSDFNFVEFDERAWPQVLHSAMAISSTTELPNASPPEEGEIPRRTSGESSDIVRLIAELMEASPAAVSPPSSAGVAGAETTSCDAAIASSLPGTSEPLPGGSTDASAGERLRLSETPSLGTSTGEAGEKARPEQGSKDTLTPSGVQAVGSDPLQPSSSEAFFEEPNAFPDHGISWPSTPQGAKMSEVGGMLESLLRPTRAAMEAGSPLSIEVVRDFLQRSTLAYHLMGCPRDPWMAAVASLWGEVRQLYQEAALAANRLKIQELTKEIASLEQETKAFCLQKGDLDRRAETLMAGRAHSIDEIAALRRTIKDASKGLAECEVALTVFDRGVTEVETERADLERGHLD
ncbi:hypothetical protein Taro_004366 [Colocasia esculenta]|uniref:Uncharacterized protein n=1 Tax=Colocasia esculenta TaxID=4460 RepID=A0A843TRG8_COLES|nr:hypothetical protein [Colocasia esculenta]